jgi:sugar/nucleoside kinase (ribokinase family)
MSLQGAILGVGNPLLDISADVSMDLLEKYNLQLNNAILAEEKHYALYPELVAEYPVQYIAGGATQNTVRVAQWMIQSPGSTAYMGAIGTDQFGEVLEKCSTDDGVLVHYMKNPDVSFSSTLSVSLSLCPLRLIALFLSRLPQVPVLSLFMMGNVHLLLTLLLPTLSPPLISPLRLHKL